LRVSLLYLSFFDSHAPPLSPLLQQPKNTVLEVYEPPARKEGIIVDDVNQLIDKLKNEAGLLQ